MVMCYESTYLYLALLLHTGNNSGKIWSNCRVSSRVGSRSSGNCPGGSVERSL